MKIGISVVLILALLAGLGVWVDQRAYERGYAAQRTKCTDRLIPAARQEEQAICRANADITEKFNAENLVSARTAAARAQRQRDKLQREYKAIPCIPITYAPSVPASGAGGVSPPGRSGLSAGWLIDFGQRCQERSDNFLQCRAFVLETWKVRGQ